MNYLMAKVSPRNEEEEKILKRKTGLGAGLAAGTAVGQGLVLYANKRKKPSAPPVSHLSHLPLGISALGAMAGATYDAYENRKNVIKIREKNQEPLTDEKPMSMFSLYGVPKVVLL